MKNQDIQRASLSNAGDAPLHSQTELSQESDSSAQPDRTEENAAIEIITNYRNLLLGILQVPDFQDLIVPCMEKLDMPGKRQGVSLPDAISSLLIESQKSLVQTVIESFKGKFHGRSIAALKKVISLAELPAVYSRELVNDRYRSYILRQISFYVKRDYAKYKSAQSLLFYSHWKMIYPVAVKHCFRQAQMQDFIQEGFYGLIQAIDKVGPSEARFKTFAYYWIYKRISDFSIGNRFPVYVPVNVARELSQLEQEYLKDHSFGCQSWTHDQEWNIADSPAAFNPVQPSLSLNSQNLDGEPVVEFLKSSQPPHTESIANRDLVYSVLSGLTDKQREVLVLRFGLNPDQIPLSCTEVSQKIGISVQQVMKREERALERCRQLISTLLDEVRFSTPACRA